MKVNFIKYHLIFCVLAVIFTLPLTAHANKPDGWWTSNSGSNVNIWSNRQQLGITINTAEGLQFKYNGWWTTFGYNFSYQVPNAGIYNASFDKSNKNRIYVSSPKGKIYTWNRHVKNTRVNKIPPKKKNAGIAGTWRSSTGSTIQISGNNKQVFLNFITADGIRFQGAGRWLSGFKFDYSVPGYQGVAECSIDKNNWNIIYCLYNGKWSTWNKMN